MGTNAATAPRPPWHDAAMATNGDPLAFDDATIREMGERALELVVRNLDSGDAGPSRVTREDMNRSANERLRAL